MHYIVTGGAGFIGSHLCEALANGGHHVTIIDDLSSGRIEHISSLLPSPRVSLIQDTVQDFTSLLEYFQGADGVFHLAAMVSVPRSIAHPLASHEVTLTGTLNVLLAARDTGVKRVVHASSAAVYGNIPDLPKREDMPVDPLSPYAVAKYAGERYCRVFSLLYGLQAVSLRFFNVYGPRQDPRSDYAAVIPRFIARIRAGEAPLIYGDGGQTRDFVYVKDVVTAMIKAMDSEVCGVFNIASGSETSVNQLASMLMDLCGCRMDPVHCPERPGEVRRSVADISQAQAALGYSPRFTLREGLSDTLASME
ncbi:MAG: UDP-galactose-4-epimerase [Methanoregulaceae archaeon PtaB.Bin152]|nr:MAG: UDP-galactose-4-epimerase [Methanoregulaceae archaeon PtaB.Bin152]OPY39240.1 MAG: UDP-galactose-4-epimerase [Methanoregulaceae archaeon PtaU1.Bin066]